MVRRKHVGTFVACLLIFASLWRLPLGQNPRVAFQAFFEISLIALFGVVLWRANKWVALFLALATVSAVYPNGGPASWLAFRSVLCGLLWYMLVVHFVNTQGVRAIMDAMCIIALANTMFLIAQALGASIHTVGFDLVYRPLIKGTGTPPVGLMANRGEASCLLAFCLPAFFSRKIWKCFLPVVIIGVVLTKSTAGLLASAAGILFYACIMGKAMWVIICTVPALILYCLYIDLPGFERWDVWKKGWQIYK